MSPPASGSEPVMAFMVVVLPAPLEPISDTSSPAHLEVHALDGLDAAVGHLQARNLQKRLCFISVSSVPR
jgi:hypothetical protein